MNHSNKYKIEISNKQITLPGKEISHKNNETKTETVRNKTDRKKYEKSIHNVTWNLIGYNYST